MTQPSEEIRPATLQPTPPLETIAVPGAKSNRDRPAWWLVLAVGGLVIAAVGGWLAYLITRPGPLPTQPPRTNPSPSSVTVAVTVAQPGPTTVLAGTNPAVTAATTPPPTQPPLAYGVVTSRVLNLRTAPSTDAPVFSSLKNGDVVELAGRNGGWYRTTDGHWVSAFYLEVRQTRAEADIYAREILTP